MLRGGEAELLEPDQPGVPHPPIGVTEAACKERLGIGSPSLASAAVHQRVEQQHAEMRRLVDAARATQQLRPGHLRPKRHHRVGPAKDGGAVNFAAALLSSLFLFLSSSLILFPFFLSSLSSLVLSPPLLRCREERGCPKPTRVGPAGGL